MLPGTLLMLETRTGLSRTGFPVPLPKVGASNLELAMVRTAEELEAVQRLRYTIFSEEMSAAFPGSGEGIDADQYDPWCEHLMVRESATRRIVGTYRLLTPVNAERLGGFYSESEFDLASLAEKRHLVVELGRSCIHRDYRNGAVIMLLWAGIASVVKYLKLRYVLGCASVSLQDGGVAASHVWHEAQRGFGASSEFPHLRPHHPYPVRRLDLDVAARMPPLIKGYLKVGGRICGEPAWDPDFNTADFPVFLDIENMDARYRRHFGIG